MWQIRWNLFYFGLPIISVTFLFGSIDETLSYTVTIGVGEHPRDISINSKTNHLYVSNYQSHSVSVIDNIKKSR